MDNASHQGPPPFIFIASAWRQCHDGNKMFCLEGSHASDLICAERKKESSILWDWHRHTLYCGSPAHPHAKPAPSSNIASVHPAVPWWDAALQHRDEKNNTAHTRAISLLGFQKTWCITLWEPAKWCICVRAATVHRANISRHSSNTIQLITQRSVTAVMQRGLKRSIRWFPLNSRQ